MTSPATAAALAREDYVRRVHLYRAVLNAVEDGAAKAVRSAELSEAWLIEDRGENVGRHNDGGVEVNSGDTRGNLSRDKGKCKG